MSYVRKTQAEEIEDMTFSRNSEAIQEKDKINNKKQRIERLGINPEELAFLFCQLDDELQTDFFVECAKIGEEWDREQHNQWYAVGRHLKTCECSSSEAREMIKAIYHGIL
jgi:hypothetical protein